MAPEWLRRKFLGHQLPGWRTHTCTRVGLVPLTLRRARVLPRCPSRALAHRVSAWAPLSGLPKSTWTDAQGQQCCGPGRPEQEWWTGVDVCATWGLSVAPLGLPRLVSALIMWEAGNPAHIWPSPEPRPPQRHTCIP